MPDAPNPSLTLHDPWLVAVWPGMGEVARLAGSHLAQALGANVIGQLNAEAFFDVDHIDVTQGLATVGQLPQSVFLLWRDPAQKRDLVIFIGESQNARDGLALCRTLMQQARHWGVKRVVTFAAMATQLHPAQEPRVFAVATTKALLDECLHFDTTALEQGQISGLNGLLLAAAQESQIEAMCLMGEMPYFAVQAPNPQASLAALEVFSRMAELDVDLDPLREQAAHVQAQLSELLERLSQRQGPTEGEFTIPDVAKEPDADEDEPKTPKLSDADRARLERLFRQADGDRSRAVELKNELDRLGVFAEYEDRFLDLFRKGG